MYVCAFIILRAVSGQITPSSFFTVHTRYSFFFNTVDERTDLPKNLCKVTAYVHALSLTLKQTLLHGIKQKSTTIFTFGHGWSRRTNRNSTSFVLF